MSYFAARQAQTTLSCPECDHKLEIARTCLAFRKPFMVVTQMLASMTEHPAPTRAEVSDIFNAVLDGASSLMLTGETAAGKYPSEAMQVLSDTAYEALRYQMEAKFFL